MKPFLCCIGRHRWNLWFRRVGETVSCERHCGACVTAYPGGWLRTDEGPR